MSRTSADSQREEVAGRGSRVQQAPSARAPDDSGGFLQGSRFKVGSESFAITPIPSPITSVFQLLFLKKGDCLFLPLFALAVKNPVPVFENGPCRTPTQPQGKSGVATRNRHQEETRHHKHVFPFFFPPWLLNGFPFPHARAEAERSAHFVLPRLRSVFPRDNHLSPSHSESRRATRRYRLTMGCHCVV